MTSASLGFSVCEVGSWDPQGGEKQWDRGADPLHVLDPAVGLSCGVPQPSVLVRICCCQRSWVLLGLGGGPGASSPLTVLPSPVHRPRGPWPGGVLPAPSWAPLAGKGVAGILGPARLASLAPFVQRSGHTLIAGAGARA